ncbi:1028_t:CDS:1, partial [Gigaspora rosea]
QLQTINPDQNANIAIDDDKDEEFNENFIDFSNRLLNIFDDNEHEFDNFS